MRAARKLENLPHVSAFSGNAWKKYDSFKGRSCLLKMPLDFAEFWIRNVLWFLALVDSKLCISSSVEVPVSVLDDYLCSQLDFFEEQLSKRKGSQYLVTEGGFVHKIWLMICLCSRLGFFLPRMCWKLTLSAIRELRKDMKQTLMLVCRLLGAPVEVRRSTRIRKARASSSPLKDKKRKRDDSDGEIEEYFAIDENYCSDEDPDYSIGASSGNCSEELESEDPDKSKSQFKDEGIEEADETKEEDIGKDEGGDDGGSEDNEGDVEKEMSEILKEEAAPSKKIEEIGSVAQ